jgi:LPXTG-motif cell wall-anchored protein
MSQGTLYLVLFLLAALAGLGGLFVFGWKRRKDKMPDVAPLPRDDDWD